MIAFEKVNLSLLAQVLAHSAGVDVVEGKGFSTNGKTISIPQGMVGNASDAKLIRGGVCHEVVGHIRHTDFSALPKSKKLLFSLVNVLEDVRIEKAAWGCYPGAKSILQDMAVEVDTRGWFNGPADDDDIESLLLRTLLRDLRTRILCQPINAKKTNDLLQRANAVFGNRWPEVIALAEQGTKGDSTQAVVASSEAILEIVCKPGATPPPQPQASPEPTPSTESGEGNDQAQGEEEQGAQSQAQEAGDEAAAGDQSEQDAGQEGADSGESEDAGNEQGSGSQESGNTSDADAEVESEGDTSGQASRQAQASAQATGGTSRGGGQAQTSQPATTAVCDAGIGDMMDIGAMLDKFIRNEVENSYEMHPVIEQPVLHETNHKPNGNQRKMAIGLSSKLEQALSAWTNDQEDSHSDRGRFDTTRLTEAMMGERDVCTRELADGVGLDTEVYFLVDRSGSMHTIEDDVNQALWGVGSALGRYEGSQLSFGVWMFDDHLYPAKRLHSRWMKDKNRCHMTSQGSTNWPGSAGMLLPQLASSRRKRKVLFTVTDGDLGSSESFDAMVNTAKRLKIELSFLMINSRTDRYSQKSLKSVSMSHYASDGKALSQLQNAIFESLHNSIRPL